jgi:hypothetical protein
MNLALKVTIIGINEIGHESGNTQVSSVANLPMLQDVEEQNVWGVWNVTYRDVVIVNTQGQEIGVYNLSKNDLNEPDSFAALKTMLVDAASSN